jgi:hypothetical protein
MAKEVNIFLNNFVAFYEHCILNTKFFSNLRFSRITEVWDGGNVEYRWQYVLSTHSIWLAALSCKVFCNDASHFSVNVWADSHLN